MTLREEDASQDVWSLEFASLYVLHAGPMATLAMNAIGRLAAEGTSLKVNADHWGDKAKLVNNSILQ